MLGVLAGCAGGTGGSAALPAQVEPALLRVEMFGGFRAERPALPPDRVALVVDATGSMASPTGQGPSRARATRAAAERFAAALPAAADLELFVLGNDAGAGCQVAPKRYDGDRDALLGRIRDLRAGGEGSLAGALDRFGSAEEGGFERVVVITALDDDCGGGLCEAVQGLAARGVRLDLVLIGEVEAPDCIAEASGGRRDVVPVPWQRAAQVPFHVESVGAEPAVVVCGEAGGLPVQVPSGTAGVVVQLDPPLRVEHGFRPGERWVLQVLDFPGLDPKERQWRWQTAVSPVAAAALERR
jgi:hypothetical protein